MACSASRAWVVSLPDWLRAECSRSRLGHRFVILADAGHADAADAFAFEQNRDAARNAEIVRRRRRTGTLFEALAPGATRPSPVGRRARFGCCHLDRVDAIAVGPLQIQEVSGFIDNGDGRFALDLRAPCLAGGYHLENVVAG